DDISRAFLAALEAPRELIHNEPFNVGATAENYLVRDVADIVQSIVPGSKIIYANTASPDLRNYRVNCDKIARVLPAYQPEWTVRRGVEQIYEAFQRHGLTMEDFVGPRYVRLKRVAQLLGTGELVDDLRWRAPALVYEA